MGTAFHNVPVAGDFRRISLTTHDDPVGVTRTVRLVPGCHIVVAHQLHPGPGQFQVAGDQRMIGDLVGVGGRGRHKVVDITRPAARPVAALEHIGNDLIQSISGGENAVDAGQRRTGRI